MSTTTTTSPATSSPVTSSPVTSVISAPSSLSSMISGRIPFFGCMFSQQTGNCTYNGVNYTPYAVLQSQISSFNSLNSYKGGISQLVLDLQTYQTNMQPVITYSSSGGTGATQLTKDVSTLQSSLGTANTSLSSLSSLMSVANGTVTFSGPVTFSSTSPTTSVPCHLH